MMDQESDPTEPGIEEVERELPADFRSGFVAVVGRPNVGKSTLINVLLGQKISIVSPKPQTTRNRLLGILTLAHAQIIFLDTPGIHNPVHQLGKVLNETAAAALPDADLILWVVDASVPPNDEDERVASLLAGVHPSVPLLLAQNKVDRMEGRGGNFSANYQDLTPRAEAVRVSATRGDNLGELENRLSLLLPLGPLLYPDDQVTDQQVRFMAGELVREQVLLHLRDEVPHSVAVLVNEFAERDDITYISAVIYVERDTQRMIILGKDGQMIKRIGQSARQQIEELLEARVYLDLWVKVRPKWRTDAEELRRLGYQMPKKKPGKGGAHRKPGSARKRA